MLIQESISKSCECDPFDGTTESDLPEILPWVTISFPKVQYLF